MDKLINSHIDKVEELERQMEVIIDQELSQLDIDEVIADSDKAISKVVDNIKRIYLDEYADKATELGFDFGRQIKKKIEDDKTLKIDKSKNPELNA